MPQPKWSYTNGDLYFDHGLIAELYDINGQPHIKGGRSKNALRRAEAAATADMLGQMLARLANENIEDRPHARKLAQAIIDASLYWTGEDEERNPALKTARTLAGDFLKNG